MEHEKVSGEIARRSALIYLPVSLSAALLFFLAAGLGDYPAVAKYGGAAWVGLLSIIVSMPVVISSVKRRFRKE